MQNIYSIWKFLLFRILIFRVYCWFLEAPATRCKLNRAINVNGTSGLISIFLSQFAVAYLSEANSGLHFVQINAKVQVVAGLLYTLHYKGNDDDGVCQVRQQLPLIFHLVVFDSRWVGFVSMVQLLKGQIFMLKEVIESNKAWILYWSTSSSRKTSFMSLTSRFSGHAGGAWACGVRQTVVKWAVRQERWEDGLYVKNSLRIWAK